METSYRHTQTGWVIIGSCSVLALAAIPLVWAAPGWPAYLVVGVLIVALAVFSGLTVEVTDDFVSAQFVLGFPRRSIPTS